MKEYTLLPAKIFAALVKLDLLQSTDKYFVLFPITDFNSLLT